VADLVGARQVEKKQVRQVPVVEVPRDALRNARRSEDLRESDGRRFPVTRYASAGDLLGR